ncbi:DUF2628 domain-containing protein [Mesorhizobium sp. NBSH29]|uniref:DUF2628 domain-containing protein n=1 Tax=Mesorhizobium sp. NBSH29 TaxID=2654249 RepID=UPI00189643DA|nr:DUF2628 domain-containing protein [Mesorhizobium sp. NBSH29]QPC86088.1 DUF2628 domain-containing protein [Mesorhizobium sp. NBSH29]
MAVFIAMEPAKSAETGDAVLVRDGFTYLAFLLPVPWLLWHRLWIEAAFALAATLALGGLGAVAGLGTAAPWLTLLVSLYLGLEASALRLWALRRRGWQDSGAFEANNYDEAEVRYMVEQGLLEAGENPQQWVHLKPAARQVSTHANTDLLLSSGTT